MSPRETLIAWILIGALYWLVALVSCKKVGKIIPIKALCFITMWPILTLTTVFVVPYFLAKYLMEHDK